MFNTINQAEFNALAAQGYNRIPLVLETFADLGYPAIFIFKISQSAFFLFAGIGAGRRALWPLLNYWFACKNTHRGTWQASTGA